MAWPVSSKKRDWSGFPLPLFSKKGRKSLFRKWAPFQSLTRRNLVLSRTFNGNNNFNNNFNINYNRSILTQTLLCLLWQKNPFLSVQYTKSPFQNRQSINFHQHPFVPFVINFFLDFSNFSNLCSKSPKRIYHQKNPFLSVQSVLSAFQKRQPINFHQHPFVPFVTKKSVFIRSIRFIHVPKPNN